MDGAVAFPITASLDARGVDALRRSRISESVAASSVVSAPVVVAERDAEASTAALAQPPIGGAPAAAINWRALASIPGVKLSASQIGDYSRGTGAAAAAYGSRQLNVVGVSLDLDTLAHLKGLKAFVQHKWRGGRDASAGGAFVQPYSNIDTDNFHAFGEVWLEQSLFGDRVRVKAGRIDFNTEFATTDHGGGFINSSMGYSPSITAAPTYPLPSNALNLFVKPTGSTQVGVAEFDGLGGAPARAGGSSRFRIAQVNQTWVLGARGLAGRLGAGAWQHTGLFSRAGADPDAAPDHRGTRGWFATIDQDLWQGGSASATPPTIGIFAQLGSANRAVDAISGHAGGGVTFSHMWARRPDDQFGVGTTHVRYVGGREGIQEAYYQAALFAHLQLTADLQHVSRPAIGSNGRFGTVGSLRTVILF
jgi:porin